MSFLINIRLNYSRQCLLEKRRFLDLEIGSAKTPIPGKLARYHSA